MKEQSEFDEVTDSLVSAIRARHKKAMREEIDGLLSKRRRKQKLLQENCGHPSTFVCVDENYHTGEEWRETYCSVCGFMLSRV